MKEKINFSKSFFNRSCASLVIELFMANKRSSKLPHLILLRSANYNTKKDEKNPTISSRRRFYAKNDTKYKIKTHLSNYLRFKKVNDNKNKNK